jgi:hypothetical protein
MALHGKHVSSVDPLFIDVGIVLSYFLNQFELADHGVPAGPFDPMLRVLGLA